MAKLWLTSFFLLHAFTLLFSVFKQNLYIITKTKKDLSFVKCSNWRCSARKVFLKISEISQKKHLCWGLFLINLQALGLFRKYCCTLATVEYFYSNKTDLYSFLFSYHRLVAHIFFFFPIFLQVDRAFSR